MSRLLVIDIGGTYLRCALLDGELQQKEVKVAHAPYRFFEEWYNQSEFKGEPLDKAVIAAAGPCDGNTLALTNVDWELDKKKLEELLQCEVRLLNDLEAAVYLLPFLKMENVPPSGVKGLIMPGTGLGEGFIVPFHEGWLPMPTEAGHTFFAPQSMRQLELLEKIGNFPIEIERLLSGGGLTLIHHALSGETLTPEEVVADEGEAVDLFAEILIDEAINFALRTLPRGGLFIGGGIVRSIAPMVKKHSHRFLEHPRMGHLLSQIPLAILKDEEIVIQGATLFGLYSS